MVERITQSQVKSMFGLFLKAIGGRPAQSYNDVGGFLLDYNPTYGGYSIQRVSNQKGGVDEPFGAYKMKSSEFWYTLRFAMDTIEVMKGKR